MKFKEFARRAVKLPGVTLAPPYVELVSAVTLRIRAATSSDKPWRINLIDSGEYRNRSGQFVPYRRKVGTLAIVPLLGDYIAEHAGGSRRLVRDLEIELRYWREWSKRK